MLNRFARRGLLLLLAPVCLWGAATVVIVNTNAPNVGFNDPTPAAPIGGNPGVTRGQQRLNAFQYAASIWGAKLDSNVTIYIQSSFQALPCNLTSAVLGAAGAIAIFANFPGAELQNTWYHAALANKLATFDLLPGPNGTTADDLVATFNANLGIGGCVPSIGWYYGLDANAPANRIDLVSVLLHEFGHGLGFANFVNEATGSKPLNLGDVYSQYTRDTMRNRNWNQLTSAEIVASAINTGNVAWDGIHTVNAVPATLTAGANSAGQPLLYAPPVVSLGSSISHLDTSATPNQLMEPFYTGPNHKIDNGDLTLSVMKDIGWFSDRDGIPDGRDACLNSDLRPTVRVGACDSGVQNLLFTSGCTISDAVNACAVNGKNHGAFVSCVNEVANGLKKNGYLAGGDHGAITSCAARAK